MQALTLIKELTYIRDNICSGSHDDTLNLINELHHEIINLNAYCSFCKHNYVDVENINKALHCLIGSSGLMGLQFLSKFISINYFSDISFNENYYQFKYLTRISIGYLCELKERLIHNQICVTKNDT